MIIKKVFQFFIRTTKRIFIPIQFKEQWLINLPANSIIIEREVAEWQVSHFPQIYAVLKEHPDHVIIFATKDPLIMKIISLKNYVKNFINTIVQYILLLRTKN